MEIYKYTSSKEIVNRLYASTRLQEDISYYDLVNWIYSVMELIGYPMQYIDKAVGWKQDKNFEFDNYVIPLPDDFHSLIVLIINGSMARPSDSMVHSFLDGECCYPMDIPYFLKATIVDNFGNVFSNTVGKPSISPSDFYTFSIQNNNIITSIKSGKACMAYKAFPIDEDGFPLIPDVEKYKMAIEMFLRMKLDYISWRNDPTNSGKKALYEDSAREYEWYVASAANHLKMPDVHRMNNIKNQMLKMVPRIHKYENYFKTLSSDSGIL